jgi:hypothetical protein
MTRRERSQRRGRKKREGMEGEGKEGEKRRTEGGKQNFRFVLGGVLEVQVLSVTFFFGNLC